jgi:hypothetical protein
MNEALANPLWTPTWDQAPLWTTDPSLIVEALEAHASSDHLTRSQIADLAGRICRRNAAAAAEVIERFRDPEVLENLVDAWASVLDAWEQRAADGPVAAAIGRYLTTALGVGLDHGQAVLFACAPDADLERQVANPGTTALTQMYLDARPRSTYAEIASALGVNASRVRQIVGAYGDPHRDIRHGNDRRDRIVELAAEGLTYRSIATLVGCSIGFVSKVLKEVAA